MLISRHSFPFSLTSHSLVTWCHVYVDEIKLLPKMEVKDIPPLVTACLAGMSIAALASLNFTSVGIKITRETAIYCPVVVHSYIRRALMDR